MNINRQSWLKTCRMSAKASNKPHLSKAERIGLMQAQIAIGGFKVQQKAQEQAWKPFKKDHPVNSIGDILTSLTPRSELE
jgi:hypothetical protein